MTQATYEDTSTTSRVRALPPETLDLAVGVDLVILEDGHLDLLALMLDALGGRVGLLLALLGTTTKTKHEMQSGLFLDVVIRQCTPIFELLAGED